MPPGMRSSLVVIALLSGIATVQAAGEAGPGTASTWTDPPVRPAEATKPPAKSTEPSTPAAASAAQTSNRKTRTATRREAAAPRKQATRRPRGQIAHEAPPPRHVAVNRAPLRYASPAYGRPMPVWRVYPRYTEAGFPPSYEDQRLDRLSTAVGSGYLVLRRRTVEYPDGRMLRYYRPIEGDDE